MTNQREATEFFPQDTIPTPREIATQGDPKRKAILAAITRIVEHRPLNVRPGNYTKKWLAKEAGVNRQALYEKYSDLWERFEFLRTEHDTRTEREVELEDEVGILREQIKTLQRQKEEAQERAMNFRETGEAFARTIVVLQEEYRLAQVEIQRLSKSLKKIGVGTSQNRGTLIVLPGGAERTS